MLISSSAQMSLESTYRKSKKAREDLTLQYVCDNGVKISVVKLPLNLVAFLLKTEYSIK